ncbi:uncharacterized protein [Leptinotarsa decemlineata]|uniref:uncharacterized protein n=1 Tax=Leptinotarsa decemlineata TaxID=7539 RepID=UPI003D3066FC
MNNTPGEEYPETGRVRNVCLKWMVKEDGALAYLLQTEEFDKHFCGNKQRSDLARNDFNLAKNEQILEEKIYEKNAAGHQQVLSYQEERDKKIAEKLTWDEVKQDKIECSCLANYDSKNPRKLYEKELAGHNHVVINDELHISNLHYLNYQDPQNNFPKAGSSTTNSLHNKSTQTESLTTNNSSGYNVISCDLHQQKEAGNLSQENTIQEEEDAELAIRLQIQEVSLQEAVEKDRLLALKTQNDELANLL